MYIKPELEVIALQIDDIVRTSPETGYEDGSGDGDHEALF